MPHIAPVVGGAIVSGVSGLVGGLVQSGAQKRAAQYEQQAQNQAIQLQREQMAEERRRYDAQQASYAQWYRQQMDIRRQIAGRYGITLPGDESAQANRPGKTSGAPMAGTMPSAAPAAPGASGLTLGGIMGGQSQNLYDSQAGPAAGPMSPAPAPTPTPPATPVGQTLGQIMGPNWSDWRNQSYG